MAQHFVEGLEDDFNHMMIGFDDDFDGEGYEFGFEITDGEIENYKTSALEYNAGKDIQGISWELFNFTRKQFRNKRLKRYKNHVDILISHACLQKEFKEVSKESRLYDFQFYTRHVKCSIPHFQRRNLLWATSKHDVYNVKNNNIMHYSPLSRRSKELLNVSREVISSQESCILSRVQICSMSVKENLLAVGGFEGELVLKYINKPGVEICTQLTDNDAINNSVHIYQSPNGPTRVMAGNSDSSVLVFDIETFSISNCFPYSWPVNSTSVSPDGKLLAVLGDSTDCIIADPQSGKVVSRLKGHLDYSFSCAWDPSSKILATGNQDKTCRVWDIRNTSKSLAVLKGNIGAVRSIQLSSDGSSLAFAESADFVHVYDVRNNYSSAQEIDFFGEISGISFSPDSESLYVGISDISYGGLIEFSRRRQYQYLDAWV